MTIRQLDHSRDRLVRERRIANHHAHDRRWRCTQPGEQRVDVVDVGLVRTPFSLNEIDLIATSDEKIGLSGPSCSWIEFNSEMLASKEDPNEILEFIATALSVTNSLQPLKLVRQNQLCRCLLVRGRDFVRYGS